MTTLRKIVVVCFALALCVSCASTPPPDDLLTEAESAIARAEASGAVEHAPIELRLARERLAGARLSVEQREYARAIRLAQQTIVNCDLAVAKTAAAKARDASRQQEEANRKLSADLDTGGAPGS
jgi:hypothetical protein